MKQHGNLTGRTELALRRRIADGLLEIGDKLPTEKALAIEFSVSRTVIREAIAALRADGVLHARHGVGVFVSRKPSSGHDGNPSSVVLSASVLDILELRLAVEAHAAGLAATRRTLAQQAKIASAAERFVEAVTTSEATEQSDWEFHRSISEATNNPAFVEFFDMMGQSILPRKALRGEKQVSLITRSYLDRSVHEHQSILDQIVRGDAEKASREMRAHLGQSQLRYSGMAGVSGGLSAPAITSPQDEDYSAPS